MGAYTAQDGGVLQTKLIFFYTHIRLKVDMDGKGASSAYGWEDNGNSPDLSLGCLGNVFSPNLPSCRHHRATGDSVSFAKKKETQKSPSKTL